MEKSCRREWFDFWGAVIRKNREEGELGKCHGWAMVLLIFLDDIIPLGGNLCYQVSATREKLAKYYCLAKKVGSGHSENESVLFTMIMLSMFFLSQSKLFLGREQLVAIFRFVPEEHIKKALRRLINGGLLGEADQDIVGVKAFLEAKERLAGAFRHQTSYKLA